MSSFLGYHTNNKEKCVCFLNEKTSLIICCDLEYLGTGMYFWDNGANAKYWYNRKYIQNPSDTYMVIKCIISTNDILDLTDGDIMESTNRVWECFKEKAISAGIKQNYPGPKLDYLLRVVPGYNCLNLVKMHAKYSYAHSNGFLGAKYVSNKTRTIYCVRNSSAIIDEPEECTAEVLT